MKSNFYLLIITLFVSLRVHTQTVVDIIVNSPDHNTLEAAVGAAGLVPTLQGAGPFTVFAPTDAAFAALPPGTVDALLADPQGDLTKILTYHAVTANALSTSLTNGQFVKTINGKSVSIKINASGVFINNAKVTVADVIATNGVVHVIDAVMLPPKTVIDALINSPIHTTAVAAVSAAQLVAPLQGTGPFTVFAPTDAAFAALPPGTIDALLADPQGALTRILTYHVAGANVLSTSLSNGQFVKTLNGKSASIKLNSDGAFINNSKISVVDIVTDNGVIHVIDAVILPPATIADILINSPVHTTLVAAANAAGLVPALQGPDELTVFAPTNEAFAALPPGTIDELLADPSGLLTDILTYHATGGIALASSLSDNQRITTINGKDVRVTFDNGDVYIEDALVTVTDLTADNGVVHVIDAILLPGNSLFDIIATSPDHNTLEAAIRAAGVANALDNIEAATVFAPTDDAFDKLPAGTVQTLLQNPNILLDILSRHVVIDGYTTSDFENDGDDPWYLNLRGGSTTVIVNNDTINVDGIDVVAADIEADNGYLHVIDDVILPIDSTVMNIVNNSSLHNILELGIKAAVLYDDDENIFISVEKLLESYGPFTLFAPIDQALNELPSGVLDSLVMSPEALLEILGEHLVFGRVNAADLYDGQLIPTVSGSNIKVRISNNDVFVNDQKVVAADLNADNGVVHAIDGIIFAQRTSVMDIITSSQIHNTLETAIKVAGLNGALNSQDSEFTVFAPTDAAFAALPAGTLDAVLADPQGLLTRILTYHVVGDELSSFSLVDGQEIATLQGGTVKVKINNDGVFINNAKVIVTDLYADNGVVHVIDAVLLSVVSTDDKTLEGVSVYPNPAEGEINVDVENNQDFRIELYDALGRKLSTTQAQSTIKIPLNQEGVYTIKVNSQNKNYIQKVVNVNR
jgi:transforming growth factor-beta-induced protein